MHPRLLIPFIVFMAFAVTALMALALVLRLFNKTGSGRADGGVVCQPYGVSFFALK
jgi:hypothetical protein